MDYQAECDRLRRNEATKRHSYDVLRDAKEKLEAQLATTRDLVLEWSGAMKRMQEENEALRQQVSDAEHWASANPAVFDDAALSATVQDEMNGVPMDASCFYPSDFWRYLRDQTDAARKAHDG